MPDVKFQLNRFKAHGYPLIEGDNNEHFYIIRQGKLLRTSSTFGDNKTEELNPGDFFGVISCMARRPAIENVETLTDTELIQVRSNDFGALLQKNTPIALKVIRYFSRRLRYFNGILTELSLKSSHDEDPKYLYDLGEYFMSKKMNFQYAGYAFVKYLKFCPNGEFVTLAKSKVAKIIQKYKLKLTPQKEGFQYIYNDDDIIFLEHEPGNELYIIQSGEVKIIKNVNDREVLLNILKNGDIFGEMAILENKPRNATAIASGSIRVMAVSKGNFPTVVQQHPEIATRIVKLLSERIWFIHRHIANALISDPETRLYDALYIQLLRDRVDIRAGGNYIFDFEYDDLIKFSGLRFDVGDNALRNILANNNKMYLKNNKISCTNIAEIESKMNLIQRNAQIQQNYLTPRAFSQKEK